MKRGKLVLARTKNPQEWLQDFCGKVEQKQLFSDAEAEYIVGTWDVLPPLEGGALPADNFPLFESRADNNIEVVKQSYGLNNTKNFFGPYSPFVENAPNIHSKSLIRRLWMLIDFVSDEFTQLNRVIMMWKRHFPGFDFTEKTAYGWSLFDVRTYAALICKGKIAIDKYNDKDKAILYQLIENPGPRESEVTENSAFYTEEIENGERYRRNNFDNPDQLSNHFKQNLRYYQQIFNVVAIFRSWDALVVALVGKILDINEENSEMFECFDYFIDNFSRAVLETFRWEIPESPKLKLTSPLMEGLLVCLIPQSQQGRFEWKGDTRRAVRQAVSLSATTWEFQGTKLKHYKFREIDIFNDKERFEFTMNRVTNRVNRAIDRYKSEEEEGLDTFIAFLLYHMEGADIINYNTPKEDGSMPTFLDHIIGLRDNGMNLSEVDISIIWKVDAILDILEVDDSMKSYELENAEDEVKQDDPKYAALIKRDRNKARQLFGMFNSYSPEATESLFVMKAEYDRLKSEFDFKTRSKINLERLEYDKSSFGKLNAMRGEKGRTFASVQKQVDFEKVEMELEELEKAMVKSSPWLWEERELVKRRVEYDEQWKFIRKLCNSDQVPWLFVNDMSGLVEDPSSGNTYGRPFSAQERSELERRQKGIPSMYWYAQPPVREMDQFDERRFHGGDGFMLPPIPERPTLDSEFVKWVKDKIAYDDLRRRFGAYEIARMFVLREPPGAQLANAGQPGNLPLLGNIAEPDDEDNDEEVEAVSTEDTDKYDEFNPPENSTVSELKDYIERWWEKNARLVNVQVDSQGKRALPKYVKIKRSAGSSKTIQFRLQAVVDYFEKNAMTDEERYQLDVERSQRIPRLQAFEKLKADLQPFLDNLQKGRVSGMDESTIRAYETYKEKMKEKWNDVSLAVAPMSYAQEAFIGRYDPEYLSKKEEYLLYLECIDFDEKRNQYDWDREGEESLTDPYKKAVRNRVQHADYALWEAYVRMAHSNNPSFISFDDYKKSRTSFKDFSTHFGNHSGRVGRTKVET